MNFGQKKCEMCGIKKPIKKPKIYRRTLRNGEAMFAKNPNGSDCIKAKNKVGVIRIFELSYARLALRFARGKSDDYRY